MAMLACAEIVTRNEDISDHIIGRFGDFRLLKVGALLFKKITNRMTICIKKLSNNRAEQMAFSRFLFNQNTKSIEIEHSLAERTNQNCIGKNHILCIQDTVEVNYSTHPEKKINFGVNRNNGKAKNGTQVRGFLAHPGLIVNAENADVLGLSSVKVWTRGEEKLTDKNTRYLEDKESYKWLETALDAKKNISNGNILTIISDQESDLYELYDRIPDSKTHLIVRAQHNRKILEGDRMNEYIENIKRCGTYKITLPAITGVRAEREAKIEIRSKVVTIKKPKDTKLNATKDTIKLTCIEAREILPGSAEEEPILWRILTTHTISNFQEAKQIVTWYTWRWNIEQIFRTMKKRGLDIEDCEITDVEAIKKVFTIGIAAAVKVLCLVNARAGSTNRSAADIFSEEEIKVLTAVLLKVNGKTKKQQNPFKYSSLSWASWIIARLGGWNGYACERPAGPITMYDGLDKLANYVEGWKLATKNVCIR